MGGIGTTKVVIRLGRKENCREVGNKDKSMMRGVRKLEERLKGDKGEELECR